MKAKEFKVHLAVTVELLVMDGDSIINATAKITERIKEQLAGHRTRERLADKCRVIVLKQTCIATREI